MLTGFGDYGHLAERDRQRGHILCPGLTPSASVWLAGTPFPVPAATRPVPRPSAEATTLGTRPWELFKVPFGHVQTDPDENLT